MCIIASLHQIAYAGVRTGLREAFALTLTECPNEIDFVNPHADLVSQEWLRGTDERGEDVGHNFVEKVDAKEDGQPQPVRVAALLGHVDLGSIGRVTHQALLLRALTHHIRVSQANCSALSSTLYAFCHLRLPAQLLRPETPCWLSVVLHLTH